MNKNLRVSLYSLVTIAVFCTFFYLYPAAIFEAKIVEVGTSYVNDISLAGFFNARDLPTVVSIKHLVNVTPTWKGWLLLIIILVGIPIMIGFRLNLLKDTKNK
ncbi:hypothetical protein [Crocinitomix algicola]|uniref:hypothetical protein n=1 Tax=Crocinitomix algicola TaxID=1740263 RepID=UPI001112D2FC|nr:hypothetical protein [Crocinitomix algicola]